MQTYRRKLKLNVEDTNCNNAHMFAENLQLTFSIHFPPLLYQIGHMLWQIYLYISFSFRIKIYKKVLK